LKIIVSSRIPIEFAKKELSHTIKIHHLLKGDNKKLAEYFSDILDIHFPIKSDNFIFRGNFNIEIFNTKDVMYYSTLKTFLFVFKNHLSIIIENFKDFSKTIDASLSMKLIYKYLNNNLTATEKNNLSQSSVIILKNNNIFVSNVGSERSNIIFFKEYGSPFSCINTEHGGDYIIDINYFSFEERKLKMKTSNNVTLQFIGKSDKLINNLKIENITNITVIE
jgi:hypothetical protein